MNLHFNCPLSPNDFIKNHCALCQHKVIDCTTKSEAEIHLLASKSEKFCGIFKSGQIKNANQSFNQTLFKIAFVFVFVLGLNESKAASFLPDLPPFYPSHEKSLASDTLNASPVIQGVITDEYGEPLPFTKVIVETSNGICFYALTDFDGVYKIPLKNIPVGTIVKVTSHFPGYQTKVVINVNLSLNTTVNMTLTEEDKMIIGLIIDVGPKLIPSDPYDFGKTNVVIQEKR